MIEYLVGGAILAAFGWFLRDDFKKKTKLKAIGVLALAGIVAFGGFSAAQHYSNQYDRTNHLAVADAALEQLVTSDENIVAIELWEANGTDYVCVAIAGIPLCDVGEEKYSIAAAAYVSVNIEKSGFHGVRLRPYNSDGTEHWSKDQYDAIVAEIGQNYKDFQVNGEIVRKEIYPYFIYFNVDGGGSYRLTITFINIGEYGERPSGRLGYHIDSWKIGEEPQVIRDWIDSIKRTLTLGKYNSK